MRTMLLATLILILLTAMTLAVSPSQKSEQISPEEYRIFLEIEKSLAKVAKKYQKNPDEVHQLYRRITLSADTIPKFGKGGVSILRDNIYIVNSEEKNELVLGGERWVSSFGNSPELVILSGRKVLGTFPISTLPDKSDFIFILFNGKKAQYLDWKTFDGQTTYRH